MGLIGSERGFRTQVPAAMGRAGRERIKLYLSTGRASELWAVLALFGMFILRYIDQLILRYRALLIS